MGFLEQEQRREAEEEARELAELTQEQRDLQIESERRRSAVIRREERRAAREEARRFERENRERADNNPLLPREMAAPRQWRNIARLGVRNEQDVYVEEMVAVDARSWQLEAGERVELVVNFTNPLPSDLTLRLTALAMELTARQVEDDTLANLMEME